MKLLDEWHLSDWAYSECCKGNNTKDIRDLITDDYWIFNYCKDIEEMWSKIRNSYWAVMYCEWVKDRSEVRKYSSRIISK